MITIVDYGMGNLGSIVNMLKKIGTPSKISCHPNEIAGAEKILLPGVGAFGAAMRRITAVEGLREVLNQKALDERVPILGVCLGMQLLTRSSEEDPIDGLNWIPAEVVRFPEELGLKVPHMGWNIAKPMKPSPLTLGVGDEPRYYFVHSYCVKVDDDLDALMTTEYGLPFASAISRNNIFGVQFHPEKSHKFGMQILRNFAAL